MSTQDTTQAAEHAVDPASPTSATPDTSPAESMPQDADAVMHAATTRIADLEAEMADMRDRWMRSEAEIQNVRTRAKRDVDEARQYAVQGFARDVVEAAENLKRGLESIPPAVADEPDIIGKLRDGFAGVERSFVALLERNGIKRTDPTGAMFDPNLHQAMSEQESAEHPPGTIIQAWTAAWLLNNRLLRPAMVVIARGPSASPPVSAGETDETAATTTQKLDTSV